MGKARVPTSLRKLRTALGLDASMMTRYRQEIRYRLGWRGRLPDFLVIGAQKCGTTSLFDAISSHPDIRRPLRKEVHFFENDARYCRGEKWYAASFPRDEAGKHFQTGEATPSMYHPLVPARVHALLPEVKLVAIFRDPVKRAFSHYRHNKARGRETGTFRQSLELEMQRTKMSAQDLIADPVSAQEYRTYSYFERGLYYQQIQGWLDYFPPDSLLVIFLDDMLKSPDATFQKVFEHLSLSPVSIKQPPHSNSGQFGHEALQAELAEELFQRYADADLALSRFLGRPLPWR